jgi:hypothetical protein
MLDKRNVLDRDIIIFISKDGTITSAVRGIVPLERAMPVYSVNNVEEVRRLQIYLCQQQEDSHPLLPGQPWFVYPWDGDVTDIDSVTDEIDAAYNLLFERGGANRTAA